MSIKKKLGMGVLSAALGLALVGGGTWAAFNDVEKIENQFAAGTLDLGIEANKKNSPISFNLGNMKPGDTVARQFKLTNKGTLAIKEVLMNVSEGAFSAGGGSNNNATEFLKQFKVEFIKVDGEQGRDTMVNVIRRGETLTLADLVSNNYIHKIERDYRATDGSQRINLAPLVSRSSNSGLPAGGDTDLVQVKIEFINNLDREDPSNPYSEFKQNVFQENSIAFDFNLEATQWDGIDVQYDDRNGKVNNGVTRSADGNNEPNPRTIP